MSRELSVIWDSVDLIDAVKERTVLAGAIGSVSAGGSILVNVTATQSELFDASEFRESFDDVFSKSERMKEVVFSYIQDNPASSITINIDTDEDAQSGSISFGSFHVIIIATAQTEWRYESPLPIRDINAAGYYHNFTLSHILAHEIAHALTGLRDGPVFNAIVNEIIFQVDGSAPRVDDYYAISSPPRVNDECFLAGTPITMADGSTKPIEEVRPDDWVLSFDPKTGETKPGRVKRTMQNRAKIVLDFHGTFVTPGHVYWCAGGKFAGRFAPLIDILRDDGVIQHADGALIRAATGCAVGSPDDEQFWALLTYEDAAGNDRVLDRRQLRFGTRWMLPNGKHFSMREYMAGIGVVPLPDGSMRWTREGIIAPFVWVLSDSLPNPEDFVLARSRTTLADIYRAGEWEGVPPTMPAPMVRDGGPVQALSAAGLASMKRNVPLAMAGGSSSSMLLPERKMNRHQRKVAEARQRHSANQKARQVH